MVWIFSSGIWTISLAINSLIYSDTYCLPILSLGFIIDGKKIKSINQFYNKEKAYYQSKLPQGIKYSKRLRNLDNKRNRRVEDYLNKAGSKIISKAIDLNVDEIIIGWNNYIKTYGIKNDNLKGKDKRKINADINEALNIYKKAVNTCNSTNNKIDYLMSRGLTIPKRILVNL